MSTDTFDDAEIRDAFAELVAGARPPRDVLARVERRIVVRRRRRRTTTGLAVAMTAVVAAGVVVVTLPDGHHSNHDAAGHPVTVISTLTVTTDRDAVPVHDLVVSCAKGMDDLPLVTLSTPLGISGNQPGRPSVTMVVPVRTPVSSTTFSLPLPLETDDMNPYFQVDVKAPEGPDGPARASSAKHGSTGSITVASASCARGRPQLEAFFDATLAGTNGRGRLRLDGTVHTD